MGWKGERVVTDRSGVGGGESGDREEWWRSGRVWGTRGGVGGEESGGRQEEWGGTGREWG